jgi:hypothetical protein
MVTRETKQRETRDPPCKTDKLTRDPAAITIAPCVSNIRRKGPSMSENAEKTGSLQLQVLNYGNSTMR